MARLGGPSAVACVVTRTSPGTQTLTTYTLCPAQELRAQMARLGGPSAVACVVTTTSCFAPRSADDVVAVAQLCAKQGEHAWFFCKGRAFGSCIRKSRRRGGCGAAVR